MKRAAVLAFTLVFAACLFHFYFAEDHCPVHCPSKGGQFGHVHPHHAGDSVCLCFWASLAVPEAGDLAPAGALVAVLGRTAAGSVLGRMANDITPPPKPSFV